MRVVWLLWLLWALWGLAGGTGGLRELYGNGACYRLDGGLAVGRGAHGGILRLTGTLDVTPLDDQDGMLLMEFVDVIVEQQVGDDEWRKVNTVGGQWAAALRDGAAVPWLQGGDEGGLRDVQRGLGALLLGAGGHLGADGGPWGRCSLQQWLDGGARRVHWQCADDVARLWRYQVEGDKLTEIVSEEAVSTSADGGAAGAAAGDEEVSLRARGWLRLTRSHELAAPRPALPPALTPQPALFETRPQTHEQSLSAAAALPLLQALAEGGGGGGGGGAPHAAAALRLHAALTHSSHARLQQLVSGCEPALLEALLEALGRCGSAPCRAAAAPVLSLGADPAPQLARAYFGGLASAPRAHEEVVTWAWEAGAASRDDSVRAAAVLGAAGAAGAAGSGTRQRVLKALARCPATEQGDECRELYVRALTALGALDALLQHAAGAGRAAGAAAAALQRHAQALTLPQAMRLLRVAWDAPALTGARPLELRAAALLCAVRAALARADGGATLLLWAARQLGPLQGPHAGELRRLYWAAVEPHTNITRQFPADVRAQQLYALNGTSGTFERSIWSHGAGAYSARVTTDTAAAAGLLRAHSVTVADRGGELLRLDVNVQGLHHLAGGEGDEDEEVRGTLGLSVRGKPLPPITLFAGQGALLGALWAGTGSDTTPVLRAHVIQRVHQRHLQLLWGALTLQAQEGAALALDARGSASLWSRTARARLALRAARHYTHNATATTVWGELAAGKSLQAEDALLVAADLDFYSAPVLCVRAHTTAGRTQHETQLTTARGTRWRRTVTARAPHSLAITRDVHIACKDIASHDDEQ